MSGFLKLLGLVLVVAFLVSKCSSDTSKARREYIAGCTQSGVPDSVCECTFDKMVDHYGDEVIGGMRRGQSVPPDLPRFLPQAMSQCAEAYRR
jgi:hypothetical protein